MYDAFLRSKKAKNLLRSISWLYNLYTSYNFLYSSYNYNLLSYNFLKYEKSLNQFYGDNWSFFAPLIISATVANPKKAHPLNLHNGVPHVTAWCTKIHRQGSFGWRTLTCVQRDAAQRNKRGWCLPFPFLHVFPAFLSPSQFYRLLASLSRRFKSVSGEKCAIKIDQLWSQLGEAREKRVVALS